MDSDEADQRLTRVLRAARVPEPPADLADRLVPRAMLRAAARRRKRRVGYAIAASLVAGLAVGLLLRTDFAPAPPGVDEVVVIRAGVINAVAVEFSAGRAVQDVVFELSIPAGFELAGHANKQQLRWSGHLKQGRNRLKLRLSGKPGSTGLLVASVRTTTGKPKTYTTLLRTVAADESRAGRGTEST